MAGETLRRCAALIVITVPFFQPIGVARRTRLPLPRRRRSIWNPAHCGGENVALPPRVAIRKPFANFTQPIRDAIITRFPFPRSETNRIHLPRRRRSIGAPPLCGGGNVALPPRVAIRKPFANFTQPIRDAIITRFPLPRRSPGSVRGRSHWSHARMAGETFRAYAALR